MTPSSMHPQSRRTIVLEARQLLGPGWPHAATADEVGPEVLAFIHDRLEEEVLAAEHRNAAATDHAAPSDAQTYPHDQGADGTALLHDLIRDIEQGRGLDPTTARLLTEAFRDQPHSPDSAPAR